MANGELTFYGALWCSDCRRSKQFLESNGITFNFIDTDVNADASDIVKQLNNGRRVIPTIVFPDGSYVTEPSNSELTAKLVEAELMAPA